MQSAHLLKHTDGHYKEVGLLVEQKDSSEHIYVFLDGASILLISERWLLCVEKMNAVYKMISKTSKEWK